MIQKTKNSIDNPLRSMAQSSFAFGTYSREDPHHDGNSLYADNEISIRNQHFPSHFPPHNDQNGDNQFEYLGEERFENPQYLSFSEFNDQYSSIPEIEEDYDMQFLNNQNKYYPAHNTYSDNSEDGNNNHPTKLIYSHASPVFVQNGASNAYMQNYGNYPHFHNEYHHNVRSFNEDMRISGVVEESNGDEPIPRSLEKGSRRRKVDEMPKALWDPEKDKVMMDELELIKRRKNFGKKTLNSDTNLSSSTDDLLKLTVVASHNRLRVTYPPSNEAYNDYARHTDKPLHNSDNEHRNMLDNMPDGLDDLPQLANDLRALSMNDDRSNDLATQQICRYFANGFCSRGERCNFLHIEQATNNGTILHKTRFKNGRSPIPASRYANVSVEECVGDIASMCLDQHGCRFLQRQLDSGNPAVVKVIFDEVISHIVNLMSDPFGNYLCQKLIEHCTEEQRLEIVKGVAPCLVQISKNMHGTRAVQKLIEHLTTMDENKIVRKALKGSVVALIQDLNGNHVIQKCLHKMEPNDNQFIYDAVAQHCVEVSTHRHGCCVMQRCIDHATFNQKLQLVEQIKQKSLLLVQDAFGNYVVQYALDLNIRNLPTQLIEQLQTKLHYLSKQKFSSNVVEKCLKKGDYTCVKKVMREFLGEDPIVENPAPTKEPQVIQQKLFDLLQDSFGNYVVQTCLCEGSIKSSSEYQRMSNLLRPYIHQLKNAPYIRRIQNLLNLPTKLENEIVNTPDIRSLSPMVPTQRSYRRVGLFNNYSPHRQPSIPNQNNDLMYSISPNTSPQETSPRSISQQQIQSPQPYHGYHEQI